MAPHRIFTSSVESLAVRRFSKTAPSSAASRGRWVCVQAACHSRLRSSNRSSSLSLRSLPSGEIREAYSINSEGRGGSRAAFSSVATKFWDIIESGSLRPSNPVLDGIEEYLGERSAEGDTVPLPNFSRIRPHHLGSAAEKVQCEYDEALEKFEGELALIMNSDPKEPGTVSYDDLLPKLDMMTFPLRYVLNITSLFQIVETGEEMKNACRNVQIHFKHGHSKVVTDALKRLELQLRNDGKPEHLKAVQQMMMEHEHGGMLLEGGARQEIAELQAQLEQAEENFTSLSAQGQLSPRDCLSLMYGILALKSERSKLLGYSSYADWSLRPFMAKDVEAVSALHNHVASKLIPEITPEFLTRYENMQKESEDLRAYFDLENVLGGLFALFRTLFGIVIKEVEKDAVNGWHTDVRLFHVSDEGSGNHIASFYLDPFKRSNKISQNFMLPLIDKRYDEVMPMVCLSCNIVPPAWDTDPAYLTFNNVVSLFHEFGHGLQHMLADVELGSISGASKIQEDASEFVSQFMEYWLYEEEFLSKFAVHAQTGETISSEQVERLKRNRVMEKRVESTRHLFLAQLELEVNSKFDPRGEESIVAVQRRVAEQYCPHEIPAKGDISPLIQIFEMNAAGKCTSQYRYLWSEVMSADAFAAFKEARFSDREEMNRVGMSFRKAILESGAALSAEAAYESFRGKQATPDALLKCLDLE